MSKRNTVTLRKIAEATGFSINTVSRALKDMPDISAATRQAIQKKAHELGYISNILASSMRSGLTHTIAVILSDIANPHFAIIVKDIVEYLRDYDYTAFVITTNEDENLEGLAIKAALSRKVDGIIICPTQQSTENIEFLTRSGIPFVLIGRYFKELETHYVICNDKLGGYQATKHLISLGHKNIMLLNAEPHISSSQDRQEGYTQALFEAGLPANDKLIHNIPVLGKYESYLDAIFDPPVYFTAIIVFSDMLAWELLDYLAAIGYRIPEDMSIIAFDDLHSQYALPFRLASITSQKEKMSHLSAKIIINQIANPDASQKEKIVLNTRIMRRNSCVGPAL